MVELLDDHEYGRLYRLALATGMRPGEYGALRWEDVDLRAKRVIVQQGIWQVTRSDVGVIGVKTHRSERPISLTDDEVELLRAQWREQERMKVAAGDAWENWGLIFADQSGRPLDQYRLRRRFHQLLKAAGVPQVNLYTLRRTMASIMHALSVPPKVIASRLGHADTQVLFEHYVKEFEAQDREAAAALEDALRRARGTRMGHAEADA